MTTGLLDVGTSKIYLDSYYLLEIVKEGNKADDVQGLLYDLAKYNIFEVYGFFRINAGCGGRRSQHARAASRLHKLADRPRKSTNARSSAVRRAGPWPAVRWTIPR